ncbi:MAG: 23S rRNA (pseudouridine(1915)-N(3))-methyltransferase RlmH [Gammaproteobacteria bacterium]|nr:23S rRNA (pseudouridine(1915)-N(3))-methyltransferase RlmH [Gammaproteobacteria bacterium]
MRLRIIAVGTKQPSWVDAAVTDYLRRFKSPWRVELLEIEAATRSATRGAEVAVQREGERVLAALRDRERVILLDETGKSLSTRELASKLEALAREAPDLALLIGGPDGHAAAVRERAAASWSLSRLTLPHGLARVLLVEQLYRAHTLASGHPYHRD